MRLPVGWLVLAGVAAGCGPPQPAPIHWGEAACDECHMPITDPRFAAELVTVTGKRYSFDEVGCMAEFVRAERVPASEIHSLWVMNFVQPDTLLSLDTMVLLASGSIRTPMLHGIVAVRPGEATDSLLAAIGGRRTTWSAVVARAAPVGAE